MRGPDDAKYAERFTLPGFRSGHRWKAALAICGYAFIGLMAVAGAATMYPSVTVLALGALLIVLLAFDAGGLRRRTPGLNSGNVFAAGASWIGVVVMIAVLSAAADALVLSPETQAERDARSRQAAADRAAREAASRGTVSTQSPQAAIATLLPTQTPAPTASPTQRPLRPTLVLSLSATTVSTDTGVRATAALQDVTPAAAGEVKYSVYNDSACSSTPAVDAGTKGVANGIVASSDAITFENAGAAYWRATYSGDGQNAPLSSTCVRLTVTLPPPVAYQVQTRTDNSTAARRRTSVRAIIPGELTKGQKIATLAALARAEIRSADVVVVFAWRSSADQAATSCVTPTVGAAELSADGRGWAGGQNVGGSTISFGPDNGQIQGEVKLLPMDSLGCPARGELFTVQR